jgi:hypothetical protein
MNAARAHARDLFLPLNRHENREKFRQKSEKTPFFSQLDSMTRIIHSLHLPPIFPAFALPPCIINSSRPRQARGREK